MACSGGVDGTDHCVSTVDFQTRMTVIADQPRYRADALDFETRMLIFTDQPHRPRKLLEEARIRALRTDSGVP